MESKKSARPDEPRERAARDHGVDLVGGARGDVRERPARLLADAAAAVAEQPRERRDDATVDHRLRLRVRARDHVAHRAQRRRLDRRRRVVKQRDEPRGEPACREHDLGGGGGGRETSVSYMPPSLNLDILSAFRCCGMWAAPRARVTPACRVRRGKGAPARCAGHRTDAGRKRAKERRATSMFSFAPSER